MKRTLIAICMTAAAAFGQTPAPGTAQVRYGDQQQRIAQGAGSGQLTARETGNLERKSLPFARKCAPIARLTMAA
jgi:hypothetical protein